MKIELGGDWAPFVKALPQGWRALGVVDSGENGEADRGALVVDSQHTFFQLNGLLLRSLDQALVRRMVEHMANCAPGGFLATPFAVSCPGRP